MSLLCRFIPAHGQAPDLNAPAKKLVDMLGLRNCIQRLEEASPIINDKQNRKQELEDSQISNRLEKHEMAGRLGSVQQRCKKKGAHSQTSGKRDQRPDGNPWPESWIERAKSRPA